MLDIIKKILHNEKIEIIDNTGMEQDECLLCFMYKGYKCYITSDGILVLDDLMPTEDQNYIKKIIVYSQKQANIDKTLPIQNIDINKLESRTIDGLQYKILMQIKNQALLFRYNGIFGINYMICEVVNQGGNFIYLNKSIYNNILVAQQNFANRTNLQIKPFNIFNDEELKTILYFIKTYEKEDERSFKMKEITTNIQYLILNILKEGDK